MIEVVCRESIGHVRKIVGNEMMKNIDYLQIRISRYKKRIKNK